MSLDTPTRFRRAKKSRFVGRWGDSVGIAIKVDIRSIIEAGVSAGRWYIALQQTIIMRRTFLRSFAPSKSSQLTTWPMMSPLQRTLEKLHPPRPTPTWAATSRFEYSSSRIYFYLLFLLSNPPLSFWWHGVSFKPRAHLPVGVIFSHQFISTLVYTVVYKTLSENTLLYILHGRSTRLQYFVIANLEELLPWTIYSPRRLYMRIVCSCTEDSIHFIPFNHAIKTRHNFLLHIFETTLFEVL